MRRTIMSEISKLDQNLIIKTKQKENNVNHIRFAKFMYQPPPDDMITILKL